MPTTSAPRDHSHEHEPTWVGRQQAPHRQRRQARALIVSSVRLYRDGLAKLLSSSEVITVVGSAADRRGAEELLAAIGPDLVLLDVDLPEALALVSAIRDRREEVSIVALGVFESGEEVIACAEAGIDGYVRRDGSLDDLLQVIESVSQGEFLCTPRVAATLLRRVAQRAANQVLKPTGASLTSREAEIARLIDQGLSNKEIAIRLSVEVATVKNHVHNLLAKLRLHRRSEAAAWLRGQHPAPLLPRPPAVQQGMP